MLLDKFIPVIYVQVSPERLTMRNVKTGEAVSDIPEVAIAYDKKERIVDVGNAAQAHKLTPSVTIVNPFAHPRSLVSDFTVAEQLLKAFLRRLLSPSIFTTSPRIILHPLGNPAGGFTQIEIRAFREMALGAGAYQAVIWQGQALNDQELLSGQFPAAGKILS